jgi:hypothetical protein
MLLPLATVADTILTRAKALFARTLTLAVLRAQQAQINLLCANQLF